ncbi:hypothetical protein Tco_0035675, partial [Tanacetum coccineum]
MAAARAAVGAIKRTKGVFVYSCKTATLGVFVSVVKTTPKWFGSCEKQQHVGAFGFVKRAARVRWVVRIANKGAFGVNRKDKGVRLVVVSCTKGAFGSQLPTR